MKETISVPPIHFLSSLEGVYNFKRIILAQMIQEAKALKLYLASGPTQLMLCWRTDCMVIRNNTFTAKRDGLLIR